MKASEYIKQGWIQHTPAKDRYGISVHANNPNATCWCMVGAISASLGLNNIDTSAEFSQKIRICMGIIKSPVTTWSDNRMRTQQEVIDVLEQMEREYENTSV